MRELAEKIVDAVNETDNNYDAIDVVNDLLQEKNIGEQASMEDLIIEEEE